MKKLFFLLVALMGSFFVSAKGTTTAAVTELLTRNKICFEISAGLGVLKPSDLNARGTWSQKTVSQIGNFYQADITGNGKVKENMLAVPFDMNAGYYLSNGWLIKVGLNASFSNRSYNLDYALNMHEGEDLYDFELSDKLNQYIPYLGIEKRFNSLGIYLGLGVNLARLDHVYASTYSSGEYLLQSRESVSASGYGAGIIVGSSYRIAIGGSMGLIARIELVLSSIKNWKGDKTATISDSAGYPNTTETEGELYFCERSPFLIDWAPYWDLGEAPAESSIFRNVRSFSTNLSSVRFMLGITF